MKGRRAPHARDPEARSFRFYARANALRDAGQYDRALADYETTLKLAPTNEWVLVDRGRTYARMGRSGTAKSDFDNALTLDASNAELRHAIEVEVAVLPAQSPPSTAQEAPPQSPPPQQPAPVQRAERCGASWAKPPIHCCPLARNSSASCAACRKGAPTSSLP
jgi:tetratricopeptide (TPR) repeat protein